VKCCSFIGAGAALGIVDHLGRRFPQFKLRAHFLNLIGLLLEARGQGLNLPFLQSDHCRLSFSCGLQFLHNALLFEQLVCRQRRPRRGNAKLVVSIYDNRVTGDWYTRDVADKAAVAHVRARRAYADNVMAEATRLPALSPKAVLRLPVLLVSVL
jgi:hypothetical protein